MNKKLIKSCRILLAIVLITATACHTQKKETATTVAKTDTIKKPPHVMDLHDTQAKRRVAERTAAQGEGSVTTRDSSRSNYKAPSSGLKMHPVKKKAAN